MIGVKLSGIKGLEAALKKKGEQISKVVDMEMQASVTKINREQKQLAPVDFGTLRSSLKFTKNKPMDYEIVSVGAGSSYAPYQEFGTGGLVDVPPGLEDVAAQYRGNKGRQINMKPQPFFFRPAFQEWNELVKRIQKLLSK